MTEFRCDRVTIKHYEKTPEGYLNFTAPIARVGALKYRSDSGIRTEFVSEQVLRDSAATFKHKPITRGHPTERVTAENAHKYSIGMTGNITWMDGGFLWINGTVMQKDAVDAILSGEEKELSCGYSVRTQQRSDGTFEQVERYGDHLATCKIARAQGAGFVLDEADEVLFSEDAIDSPDQAPPLPKPKASTRSRKDKNPMTYKATLDGIEMEFDSLDTAKHVQGVNKELIKLRSDHDSLETKLKTAQDSLSELRSNHDAVTEELTTVNAELEQLNSELAEANGKITGLETSLDSAESRYESLKLEVNDEENTRVDNDEIAELISERLKVWAEVDPIVRSDKADYEPDYSLSPIEIMAEAVKVRYPNLNVDGLDLNEPENAGFVKGLYSVISAATSQPRKTGTSSAANVDSMLVTLREGRSDLGLNQDGSMMDKTLMEKARLNYTSPKKRRGKKLVVVEDDV